MSEGFLLLEIAGAAVAVDSALVVDVAEAGTATRLPFAPPHVEGVANVAGRLMPVVDLIGYAELGLSWREKKGGLFVALRAGAGTLALRAGRIGGRIGGSIDRARVALRAVDGASPVVAGFVHEGQDVRVIDPARVAFGPGIGSGMGSVAPAAEATPAGGAADAPEGASGRSSLRLLVVEAGGRGYALDMRDIVLVFAVSDLRSLPNAPPVVCGLTQVQRRPVLLTDPLGARRHGGASGYAVVHETPHGPVGVRVEAVRGIVRVSPDRLKPAQGAQDHTRDGALDDVVDYDGSRLDVRSGPRMLGDHLKEIGPLIPDTRGLGDSRLPQRQYRRFLTFTVEGRLYALPVERVRRVVEGSARLRLPAGGRNFDGITDVDGTILPVLDLRRMLARRSVGRDPGHPGTAILVEIAEGTVAVLADAVRRIRKVSADEVDPMADRLTGAVVRLDGALVPVLRPEGLLSDAVPPRLPVGDAP